MGEGGVRYLWALLSSGPKAVARDMERSLTDYLMGLEAFGRLSVAHMSLSISAAAACNKKIEVV